MWRLLLLWGTLASLLLAGAVSYSDKLFVLYERLWIMNRMGYDAFVFFSASLGLQQGINPYQTPEIQEFVRQLSHFTWEATPNNHPPPFYLLWMGLTWLPFPTAYLAFLAVSWVSYAIGVLLTARALLPAACRPLAVGAVLTLASWYLPLFVDLTALGQVGLLLTALLSLTLVLSWQGYDRAAGVCWAFAILIKMHPLLLALYFRRRPRVLAAGAVTLAATSLLSVLAFGAWPFPAYLADLTHQGFKQMPIDQSLIGLFSRAELSPALLKALYLGFVALSAGLLVLAERRAGPRGPLALFGAYLVAIQLLAPWSFPHHHAVMVPALIILLRFGVEGRDWLPWLLVSVMVSGLVLEGEIVPIPWVAMAHQLFYALKLGTLWMLTLFAGFLALTVRRSGSDR